MKPEANKRGLWNCVFIPGNKAAIGVDAGFVSRIVIPVVVLAPSATPVFKALYPCEFPRYVGERFEGLLKRFEGLFLLVSRANVRRGVNRMSGTDNLIAVNARPT